MAQQDTLIPDGTLTKEQKEKLEQEFFQKQQLELKKGKLFLLYSVIALFFNALATFAFYPFYLKDLLRSVFFITDPTKLDDFALPEWAILFIVTLIILIVLCVNLGMAILTSVCAVKKKGAKPSAAVSFVIAAIINVLISAMQLSSTLTYQSGVAMTAMVFNFLCLALCCVGIYFTIFKNNISDYTYSVSDLASESRQGDN